MVISRVHICDNLCLNSVLSVQTFVSNFCRPTNMTQCIEHALSLSTSEYIYAIIYVSIVYCLSHVLCPIIKGDLSSTDDEGSDSGNTLTSGMHAAEFNLMCRLLWATQYRVVQA